MAFRAQNVRSFRDELSFSLLATTLAEPSIRREVVWREGGKPLYVLPVAGLFGANASGKSNVLRALADMRAFVLHSFRHASPTGGMPQRPFQLDSTSVGGPSRFEIDLVLDGVRHEYGLTIDGERVLDEWAVRYPKGRSVKLFDRVEDRVDVGAADRAKGRAVRDLLRPNALFLSTAASANHPALLPLYGWFERNLLLAEASSRDMRQALTTQMLDDPGTRNRVLEFLRIADLGVTGARRHEMDPETKDRLERVMGILFGEEDGEDTPHQVDDTYGIHLTHSGASEDVELHPSDESLGTLVWFGLVGPVIQALRDGSVFLADELDASLHPVLVAHLISLFQSPEANPRRAQLVFNSHDTTILSGSAADTMVGTDRDRLLGRDQVWFTEKANDGATRLYPLADLDPRKDEAMERRYLAGRYGATPIISSSQLRTAAHLVTNGSTG